MEEAEYKLPEAEYVGNVHQAGYRAHKLGLPWPIQIHDSLWNTACVDHPAFDRAGLPPGIRIDAILGAFYFAGEEAARTKHADLTISFTMRLHILKRSILTGKKTVRKVRRKISAIMHGDKEGNTVFTLWSEP